MCLPNILFPVFMFAFIFHHHSFSPCWPLAFLIFSLPLFSITRFSSFSVIHIRVNIKDTALLLFFLSKSPGGHVISFQIKPWVAFGLPFLSIKLFYIGMPVVRRDDCLVYSHVMTKFSQMGRLPHFLSYGAPTIRGANRELTSRRFFAQWHLWIAWHAYCDGGESDLLVSWKQQDVN